MTADLPNLCAPPRDPAATLRSGGAARRPAYAAAMRWLALVVVAGGLARALSSEAPEPLLSRAADLAEVYPALMALSTGDARAIEALPAHLFVAPTATPDANDPALCRRWTLALPAALARLPLAARGTALAALDRRYRALAASAGDDDGRARLALAFLPAPDARAAVAAAADRAFDRGDLRRFLALASRLDLRDERHAVARRLLGSDAEIEPGSRLGAPGLPVATAAVPGPPRVGATVRFHVVPGWLLAGDPWGGVLWQYRLEHRATVVPGDGGALIQDSAGLRLVDEDGVAVALPPAPAGARLLAVAGGAAWFATGATVYRLDLAGRGVVVVDLPEPPLSAPLVRGDGALWLTASEVLLVSEGRIGHRLRHGLSAGPGWRLGSDGDQPLVIAADGRAFHLSPLTDQLAQATPSERLRLLLLAARPAEALALWRATPELADDGIARGLALRAMLADRAALIADPRAALALAASAQDQATVLACAGALEGRLGVELEGLCARQPDVLINLGDHAWADDPARWDWALAGRAWPDRGGVLEAWRLAPGRRRAVAASLPTTLAPPSTRRLPDGGWEHLDRRYRCDATLTATELTCRDGAGRLLWRQRWPAPDPLAAPGRALAFRDGCVVIAEGAARLTVLDAGNGEIWAALRPPSETMPQQVVLLGRDRVAELGPLGLDTTLRLIGADGATAIALPSSARWMVPWGEGVLVALGNGQAIAYPAGDAVELPDDLLRGPLPAVTAVGLVRDGRCWSWR